MCGICGVISADDRDLSDVTRRMTAALFHRGPDSAGNLEEPGIGLGMRRLSIIDRATGQQPLFNEDGSVAVIFNGEIYNFEELRQQLEGAGHVFRTRSDTEAIVHAYEEWGDGCLTRMRGMFGLAIYDRRPETVGESRRARILLARDRLGIKPLYYTRVDGLLLFASEVRALLASGVISRELSQEGLESYLLFGSVSEPETMIRGVQSLPPGHALVIEGRTTLNESTPQPYWRLEPSRTPDGRAMPRTEAARTLRALLEDSIRLHLTSDEPLGVFLSGGVDSTAMATLASRIRSGVRCYTIRFREQAFDESDAARRTAGRLGVEHCELEVTPRDMLESMDSAISALDQPSYDGINTYCVSGAVRRAGVKVALSGLGGDELFGGYRTFRWIPRLTRLSAVARWAPEPLRSSGARAISEAGRWMGRPEDTERIGSLWRNPDALPHPFFFARTVFGPEEIQQQIMPWLPKAPQQPWRQWLQESAGTADRMDSFGAISYLEMRSYMLNTLLRDADAMSMAHSLELRVPLLDHPIVEFVVGQRATLKQRRRSYKPLLVDALGDLLPREVIERPKQGFSFPWSEWMKGPLASRIGSQLRNLAPALNGRLQQQSVTAAWKAFQEGRIGWRRPWSLYVLNEWACRHL